MKKSKLSNLLLMTMIGLFILIYFIGCNRNPLEPFWIKDLDNWDKIYTKYYVLEDINVRVRLSYYTMHIAAIDSFEISNCNLFVDGKEIELRRVLEWSHFFSVDNAYLEPGNIYNIKLIINDISYETEFRMPCEPSIMSLPPSSTANKITVSWTLTKNSNAQYIGLYLERNDIFDLAFPIIVGELAPSRRTTSLNIQGIPKNYTIMGVTVNQLNFEKKNDVLFIADAGYGIAY